MAYNRPWNVSSAQMCKTPAQRLIEKTLSGGEHGLDHDRVRYGARTTLSLPYGGALANDPKRTLEVPGFTEWRRSSWCRPS